MAHSLLTILPLLILTLSSLSSAYNTEVTCGTYGSLQNPEYIDIDAGISHWFAGSDTGPKCQRNEQYSTKCPVQSGTPTECVLQGNYDVWNPSHMSCDSYNLLRYAAQHSCGVSFQSGGYADCSCAVYAWSPKSKAKAHCLVATFSYHASGTAVRAPDGATSEPEYPAFFYHGRTISQRKRNANGSEDVAFEVAPVPHGFNAQHAPKAWTVPFQGSCSNVH